MLFPSLKSIFKKLQARELSIPSWIPRLMFGVIVYVLSIGPVLRLCNGPFNMSAGVGLFYRPVEVVMNASPSVAATVTWYVRRCGVDVEPHPLAIGWEGSRGKNLKMDPVDAATMCRNAAYASDPAAQLALSKCYASGIGVPADSVQALMWWLLALENSDVDFRAQMGQFELSLTSDERIKAEKMARVMSKKLKKQ